VRSAEDHLLTLDLRELHLSQGLYFLRIEENEGSTWIRKLLVE
jgi:hypothetical protein